MNIKTDSQMLYMDHDIVECKKVFVRILVMLGPTLIYLGVQILVTFAGLSFLLGRAEKYNPQGVR